MIRVIMTSLIMSLSTSIMAETYPIQGMAVIEVIRCELDVKPTVKGTSGNLSKGTYQQEELEMDMLTFYCQVHAKFDGDMYLIALRSTTPPKQGDTVVATLLDEYTLLIDSQ